MTSDDFVPAPLRRLWGMSESSRLGRPASLDVNVVVAAAVEIADRDGLDGVTLPKVAKSLGFTSMSLYRHVGSKDELLTLMADAALGPPPNIAAPDWREGLRRLGLRAPRGASASTVVDARARRRTALGAAPDRLDGGRAGDHVRHPSRLGAQDRRDVTDQRLRGPVGTAVQRTRRGQGRRPGPGGRRTRLRPGAGATRQPRPLPETARLFSSTLFEAPPSDTPDEAIADADFTLGLELILDGVAVRMARSDP